MLSYTYQGMVTSVPIIAYISIVLFAVNGPFPLRQSRIYSLPLVFLKSNAQSESILSSSRCLDQLGNGVPE